MDGDRRAGTWSRQQARQLHIDFVRERWRPIAFLVFLIGSVTAIVAFVVPGSLGPFAVGVGAASAFWYVALVAVQVAGTTNYLLGAHGEEWTSDELRRLERRGWHLIEHVPLEYGDIDHALLGPGGVYAIETKTTAKGWNVDKPDGWLVGDAIQAGYGADRLRRLLRASEIGLEIDVTPVLVLWGDCVGSSSHVDGVLAVRGPNLRSWTDGLGGGVLEADEVTRAEQGLRAFVARRDEHIRTKGGPRSLLVELGPFAILGKVTRGLLGGLAALLALTLLGIVVPLLPFLSVLFGAVVIGVVAMRSYKLRLAALGWTTVAAVEFIVFTGLVIFDRVR